MVARNARWWSRATALGLLAWDGWSPLSALADIGEPKIGIVVDLQDQPLAFEAVGLSRTELLPYQSLFTFDPAFQDVFAVYVVTTDDKSDKPNLQAMAGRYSINGARITFVPRHPLKPGLTYRAVLKVRTDVDNESQKASVVTIEREYAVPILKKETAAPTLVQSIFPTSEELPENHLRFYIHFSQPMARGEAYDHLELLNAAGEPIEAPFLEIGEELWDPHSKRFTLLLDPGRVKQGLKPREELGPVLQQGNRYTLRIKAGWRDAEGHPLSAEHRKEFSVTQAIHQSVDLQEWAVQIPNAETNQPLIIDFPRPLDQALLERTIWIVDSNGQRLQGTVTVSQNERRWAFAPSESWHQARYQLLVEASLEDTSGNSISRPFEIDEELPITRTVKQEIIRLPFFVSLSSTPGSDKAGVQLLPQAQGGHPLR